MKSSVGRLALVGAALMLALAGTISAGAAPALSSGSATRQIAISGTSSPQTGDYTPSGSGDVTQAEFPGQTDSDAGATPYGGTIIDRSLSKGTGNGVSMNSGKKAKSNPQFDTGFEGLNFFQQRWARGGNQFSLEPPDQALCVGNGYEVEAVNDVLNIYNASGQSVLPDSNVVNGIPTSVNGAVDLNSFFGYPPAIDRKTGVRGPFLSDPSCLYDAATQRFFMVILTMETHSDGSFTLVNHLDIAVSQTADPTGRWSIYRTDVTNDGSNPDPRNACPCLGDYPHIGADAYGFYISTNAYPWLGYGFDGAQIYALSKAQLASGSASVTMSHIDTFGIVNAPSDAGATQPGFTVWPAQSPGTDSFALDASGTEYFMSSNATDEATHPVAGYGGSGTSSQLVVWALTNTSSLNSATPALSLHNTILSVNPYGVPPAQRQPGSGSAPSVDMPLGHCINDTTTWLATHDKGCWRLLFTHQPANVVVSRPDSNDTRMQQVMYANGKLWGALDTALNPDGGGQRAGISYYVLTPAISDAQVAAHTVVQGYLGVGGADLTYPAIGVTASGRGVMAFTYTGDTTYPSAAYAPIDANVGVGNWSLAGNGAQGAAAEDGATSYPALVGGYARNRWGDYGAAAVDGNTVWIASEYIAHACDYTQWGGPFFAGGTGDIHLGTCAGATGAPGVRAALGNWSTRISKLTP